MTAPIKTCNYCGAVGVMPTFMNGETVCYDCLPTLPKTLREAWREIAALRAKIEQMEKQEPVAWLDDGTCRAGSKATAHRVVTNETKRDMPASVAASFSVPLCALPIAQGEEK